MPHQYFLVAIVTPDNPIPDLPGFVGEAIGRAARDESIEVSQVYAMAVHPLGNGPPLRMDVAVGQLLDPYHKVVDQ